MRTFAQNPKALQPITRAKPTIPARLQNRELHPIPQNANTEERKGDSATTAIGPFGHDFSRIPVHAATPATPQSGVTTGAILRRKCSACAESAREEESDGVIRRQPDAATGAPQSDLGGVSIGGPLPSPGQPLGGEVRAMLEPEFGRSLGDVRVRADADAARAADSLHARAFTVGSSIWFGAGEVPARHQRRAAAAGARGRPHRAASRWASRLAGQAHDRSDRRPC